MSDNYMRENPNDLPLKRLYDQLTANPVQNRQRPVPAETKSVKPKEDGTENLNLDKESVLVKNAGKDVIIHVNKNHVSKNNKYGEVVIPTYVIRYSARKTSYTWAVDILGKSTLADPRNNKPLKCGAKNWIVTQSDIVLHGEFSYDEVVDMEKKYKLKNGID